MSILNIISRRLNGLLNDAAESAQDPGRDARQIVRELDESISKAEDSLIEIEAQVSMQRSKRDIANYNAEKYENGAKRALQAGDEALTREALNAQINSIAERDAITKELAALEPSLEKLKKQINEMHERRNNLNSRSKILQAEQQIAKAKNTVATALGGIGGQNFVKDFQKLEDTVALQNARSDSRLNSVNERSGKSLDDKLAALSKGNSVEDHLEALKKRIDKTI
ncbi:PspA/IM30 family protein [Candidatus Vallotia lariciata]|uniref:PspA/IM30 family protein n=1 Tax=Candidatus Vallotia laricis TaxID=2018052 RepID=UPI001D0077E2|nr:PspA/IM30 family protein [Candidatus Vallotia lariciata]UDG83021.1 Phage shock protein A [Candidatus Vallotia lariciata]